MTAQKDDLEAVRAVAEALDGFDANDQERIIRWAREKLGLGIPAAMQPFVPTIEQQPNRLNNVPVQHNPVPVSLKVFVAAKNPKNDVQFAATVAYFHRFEAPQSERKNEINSDDLQEDCRLAGRTRLKNPGQTLQNAHKLGLLDRVSRGTFTINSVGENLVAMTLPGDPSGNALTRNPRKNKSVAKKAARPKGRK
jgi:hypothetical protein